MSSLTFFVYYKDKRAAINNTWRIQEKTLHLLAVLGGWPGAFYAQKKLRHKSIKQSFRLFFYVTVIGNLMLIFMVYRLIIK